MKKNIILVTLIAFLFTGMGMFLNGNERIEAQSTIEILGAGASFPKYIYLKMFDEYYKETNEKVQVNYNSIGSGGGIKNLLEKIVDFGATDAPMDDETLAQNPEIIHIPTCIGAVAIAYNIDGIKKQLHLTPDVLADIYLGNIVKWNDSKLTRLNPSAGLPNQFITVCHRADSSGTTYTFSDYLSSVSSDWEDEVGTGKSLNWPVGLGGQKNDGVAGLIKQNPGSIGYVSLEYALDSGISVAKLQNKSGKFIEPTLEGASLSADIEIPDHTRVSIVNTSASNGYPIATFTWIILYKELTDGKSLDKTKASALVDLLWWMTHDGQKYCKDLNYAPLSNTAVKKVEALLKSVTYNGSKVK